MNGIRTKIVLFIGMMVCLCACKGGDGDKLVDEVLGTRHAVVLKRYLRDARRLARGCHDQSACIGQSHGRRRGYGDNDSCPLFRPDRVGIQVK